MSDTLTTRPASASAVLPLPGVKPSALAVMASRFDMEPKTLMDTLKNTVFKNATNEQLAALVVVANEHGLNPFTREIYAFPDKGGGIQAVIGVDGWLRIITQNPNFDGFEHEFTGEGKEMACTVTLWRTDISRPVRVTEYMSECSRNTDPWRSHPRRMLRHKALIQAGRIAFGLGSLKDEDDVPVMRDVSPVAEAVVEPAPLPERKQAKRKPEPQADPEALELDAGAPTMADNLRSYLSTRMGEADFLKAAEAGGMFLDASIPLNDQPADVLADLWAMREQIAGKGGEA